ncbi:MAG: 50S ribosomal protein L31e [Nanoarchaeota archaeon]|nr:50S ribosomal protein L31e [Nanoarchaeota archaeon]
MASADADKVGKEKETKKLDDLKNTGENKKAIVAHTGVPSDESKAEGKNLDEKEEKKVESKPAVAKAPKSKKGEIKVELEREYIVPLKRGVLNVPHYKRAKKAVRVLKEFMVKHMGVRDRDLRKVKVDINLNNEIWFRGIKKPMNKIKVKAKKIDGIVYVELAEIPKYVGFKIAREEKKKAASVAAKVKMPKKVKEEVVEDADRDGIADKTEEKEDRKAGGEADAKFEKSIAKNVQHSTKGAHLKKTMPVRKSLKK